MSPKDNFLHIEDVYKAYGPKLILDDIDLSVKKGEFCTVIGPSGCGKSTLLRLILGQEPTTKGKIYLDGEELGYPDTNRGIVYQKYSLFPHLTVIENVLKGKRLLHSPMAMSVKAEDKEEAIRILTRMRMEKHLHKYPHELSGGMQQRVAIAQALIMRPKILLMDEPFGALDPGTREDMQMLLLEIWEESKMTIFFVTHDLEEAVYLGTRLIVLSQFYTDGRGEVSADSKGAKIVSDYNVKDHALAPSAKETPEFVQFIAQIRKEGFHTKYKQHILDFNLNHPDSFQTVEDNLKKRT